MIHGMHASSVVFLDLHTVASGVARLSERLPGVDASGHTVSLGEDTWVVRLGGPRTERHALCYGLQLAAVDQPYRSELRGVLRFQEIAGRPRTKVTFEGTCARGLASSAQPASTEDVLHAANDLARRTVDLVVNVLEEFAQARPQAHSAAG